MYRVNGVAFIVGNSVGDMADPDTRFAVLQAPGELYTLNDLIGAAIGPVGVHPGEGHDFTGVSASYGQRDQGQIVQNEMEGMLFLGESLQNGIPGSKDLFFGRSYPERVIMEGFQEGRDVILIILRDNIGGTVYQGSDVHKSSSLVGQVIFS